jgi:prepilin peptidase CpaA
VSDLVAKTQSSRTKKTMSEELAQRIFGTPGTMGLSVLALLGTLLLIAAWFDLHSRRIPNALVFPGAALAVVLHGVLPAGEGFLSSMPGGLGSGSALLGLSFGFLALLPLYLWCGMGAGDVKLAAMLGAFLGPLHIWPALLATVLAGGGLAVAIALRHSVFGQSLNYLQALFSGWLRPLGRLRPAQREHQNTSASRSSPALRLPYAVAVAIGGIGYLFYYTRLMDMR